MGPYKPGLPNVIGIVTGDDVVRASVLALQKLIA